MQNFRCVLATDLHPVRMTRAPLQPTCAQRTHSVSFLQFFPWSLAQQTAYLARALSVRGPCLLRTSQVQLSNEKTELTWTVPSKHVLRTYNALISAVEQVTVGKGGTSGEPRKVVHIYPHADIGRTNSHSSHLHALTTCEWVRTPCVSSTCKYDPRTITWKSHGDRTF